MAPRGFARLDPPEKHLAEDFVAATVTAVLTADKILEKMREGNDQIEKSNAQLIARLDQMHVSWPAQ